MSELEKQIAEQSAEETQGTPNVEATESAAPQPESTQETQEDAQEISNEDAAEQLAKEKNIQGYHRRQAQKEAKQTVEEQVKQVLYTEKKQQLLNEVTDEATRALIQDHLDNTIKPSGDIAKDFANAKNLVDAEILRIKAKESARIGSQKAPVVKAQSTASQAQATMTSPEDREVRSIVDQLHAQAGTTKFIKK